jgi:hypothetical protein
MEMFEGRAVDARGASNYHPGHARSAGSICVDHPDVEFQMNRFQRSARVGLRMLGKARRENAAGPEGTQAVVCEMAAKLNRLSRFPNADL